VVQERLDAERVGIDDIRRAGRETQGVANLGQIQHAVLETDGAISVIPRE
jgi:uncharacterized membrane protein YcaP (DUF421 family)